MAVTKTDLIMFQMDDFKSSDYVALVSMMKGNLKALQMAFCLVVLMALMKVDLMAL